MQSKFNFASDWSNAVDAQRNSIVFENKNKAYGAFVLRNNYERNMVIAFFSSFFIFAILILLPMLFNHHLVSVIPHPPKTIEGPILTEAPPIIPDPPIHVEHPPFIPPNTPHFNIMNLQTTNNDDDDTMAFIPPVNPPENSSDHGSGKGENTHTTEVTHVVIPPIPDPNKTWTNVQEMPEFVGGDKELYKFLGNETHYPEYSRENNIEGIVYLSFVINQDGSAGDIKVLRGVDNFLNNEAIRVLKKMPKWKPGKQNGNPVRVQLTLPVKFEIKRN